ncbi:MAG: TonB-dependent receptor, partial [Opitutus sp.]
QPNLNRFRGQPVNGTFRNGLNQSVGFDTENVDRIEVAKGPLSVFVGGATLGGEINVVTKKPLFSRKNEITASIGEHETYGVTADLTGPIDERKTLAYRLIAAYKDGNTWRDFSHRATEFIEPQILWRPTENLIARVDYVHRLSRGNNISQNVSDTGNYQADFDSPRQILLDQGKKRTGALAGIPYTTNEYRARIGQAFGNWRQDVFDATGKWTTLGGGELGLTEGLFPGGRTYNSYGPHAGVTERSDLLESEVTLVATDWLQARFLGRGVKSYNAQDYFSFSQRLQPSGSYSLTSGYQGARFHNESRDAKLEAVLKHKVWIADVNFLVGGQYGDNKGYNERAIFDYTNVPSIASSPNVIYGAPQGTLTGANVYTYFDPRVHPFPDNRLITRWPSDVSAAGVMAFSHLKVNNRAVYAAGSGGFFNDRVILTGGVRRTWLHSVTSTSDRSWTTLTSTSTGNPYTDNWTAGIVVQLLPGLNAYASTSEGETIRTGSLIGRVTFGTPAPPLDIVSPAEQAANPVPNAIGKGKEAGLKFELFKRKLTGSIGWFQLSNGNFIVIDNDRNATDARNIGTEVDPNPATSDPGRRLQVSWSRPIDGNETAGFETDLVWAPTPSYSVVFAASHLYTNKLTVVQPATADPANQRTYLILNGRGLDNSPDDIVRVFQNYRFTNASLRGANVGLGVRYQSSQSPSYSDANWGQLFPSYTVVDLVLGYSMKLAGNPVSFQLGVNNLTNKSYWTGNRIWGAPREFSLVTRYQF